MNRQQFTCIENIWRGTADGRENFHTNTEGDLHVPQEGTCFTRSNSSWRGSPREYKLQEEGRIRQIRAFNPHSGISVTQHYRFLEKSCVVRPSGAHASARVYTLVEMAKAHNLNVEDYLVFLLNARPHEEMTDKELEDLMPWNENARKNCAPAFAK